MTPEEMLDKLIAIEEMVAELRLAVARNEIVSAQPEPEPEPKPESELEQILARISGQGVTFESVRNVVAAMGRTFSVGEVAALLDAPEHIVYRHISEMAMRGTVTRSQATKGRRVIEAFTYVKPTELEKGTFEPNPTEKPRGERHVTGVGQDSQADGMAVRVPAVKKLHRRGRSTPGVGHKAKQTDRRYEKMQEARKKQGGKDEKQ